MLILKMNAKYYILTQSLSDKWEDLKDKYARTVSEFNYDISKKNEELQFLKLNYDRMVRDVRYFNIVPT
jgi:hypothetical protein